jgi:hypothetical protein
VSFDGGETWPVKRLVRKGPGNYTWLAAGRKGTPSEGMIYLAAGKDWMARFNLAWILQRNASAGKISVSATVPALPHPPPRLLKSRLYAEEHQLPNIECPEGCVARRMLSK